MTNYIIPATEGYKQVLEARYNDACKRGNSLYERRPRPISMVLNLFIDQYEVSYEAIPAARRDYYSALDYISVLPEAFSTGVWRG